MTVWGRVVIDGLGAYDTFTVRLKNKETGQEYWPAVSGGDGWYSKEQVEEGWYTITHWHDCPGNNNFDAWIGVGAEQAPQINLTCTQPKPKVTVWGRVVIDGKGAYDTFTVRLKNKETGQEYWPKVSGGDGWYSKEGVEEGTYTVTHWHDCPGNNNVEAWIGVGAETAPEINLVCESPKPKHTLSGKVTIDGVPAYKGFGVLLDGYGWYIINNDEGRYTFNNIPEGMHTVRHNFNICPTNEGNPQVLNVDGRAGPNFSIVCPKVEPVPTTPEPQPEPTCSEILKGLGISTAQVSSVQQTIGLFLPVVIGNSAVAPTEPTPVVGYKMDESTFIRLGTKLDDIEKYITVTTVVSDTVLVFDFESARSVGFEPMLIDLANQQVQSINAMMEGVENFSGEDYPLLQEYNDAATRYANSPRAANAMNEVRGLSVEQCVCGSEFSPRPAQESANRRIAFVESEDLAKDFVSQNYPTYYIPFLDWMGDGTLPKSKWEYVTPHSWKADICGQDTYQDNIHITGPMAESEGSNVVGWEVTIQDYTGFVPRGEPNVDIKLHLGPANWPYLRWPEYVFWWHVWGPGK